jgi:hypothetical protein
MNEEMNLLAQLHKLASRQDENFLTEAFAHLLRHLRDHEPRVAADIICRLTRGRFPDIGDEKLRSKLRINTQVATEQGRPDIEIAIDGQFRALIEAKVESKLHDGQLQQYRKQLDGEGALVLLTRYPFEPPANETQPDVLCRWYQLADWLETACEEARIRHSDCKFLTEQFVDFLKIRNIAMEKAGPALAEGVKSLTNVLRMLDEAIIAKSGKAKGYHKFTSDQGSIGYSLDSKKFFVGIDYEEPEVLYFLTLGDFAVKNDAAERAGFGMLVSDKDGRYWQAELNFYSDDVAFFGLSKDEQRQRLDRFVSECLDATKKIKGR